MKPEREGGLQHMTQGASRARGTVRWFSNEGDHGFVSPDDGGQDVHVRREHIVGDGAELLEKGDRVTYDMSEDAKGLWARNVSREEQRRYSWRDDCLERHEGKEARHEYYARLDEGEGL
jgi:cold shock protein